MCVCVCVCVCVCITSREVVDKDVNRSPRYRVVCWSTAAALSDQSLK